ncbi:MAG: hypothetical protein H6734_06025 [Alphaproteobacteria bacterium]|nr:hypothetical protein [Alphaproteobacteria bacterium]
MAINPRGSRPLVVRGMGFRWRQQGDQLAVWHTLDQGVLTLHLPTHRAIETPRMVARAVEQALDAGWRTVDHRDGALDPDTFYALHGFTPESRGFLPVPHALARERGVLLPPDVRSTGGPTLRVLYLPAGALSFAITAWRAERTAVQLDATVAGTVRHFAVEVDPEVVEDLLVAVRAAPVLKADQDTRACLGDVTLHDGHGDWQTYTDLANANGRAREAGVRAWRLACEVFTDPEALGLLWEAHAFLEPDDTPLTVDPERRRVAIYGRWDGDRLAEALATLEGPWVVDGSRLRAVGGETARLRRWARIHRTSTVWIGDGGLLQGQLYLGVRLADDWRDARRLLEEGAHELLEQALLARFDPRWSVRAGEWLTSADPARRTAAWQEIHRWLGPGWEPWTAGEVAGWRFTERFEGWREGLPEAGLVLHPRRFWVVTADGRAFSTRA